MKKILIFSLGQRWIGISRLPKAIKDAGFHVAVLCHKNSVVAKTKHVDSLYLFDSPWMFQKLFKKILKNDNIDFIIPGGDNEVLYLHQIFNKKIDLNIFSSFRKKLLKGTFKKGNYKLFVQKSKLQKFADNLEVRTPHNKIIRSIAALKAELPNRKYPVVLKSDFGAAGSGVRICNSVDECVKGFNELKETLIKVNLVGKIKEGFKKIIDLPLYYKQEDISIQDYVEGTPCMHGLFASDGKVMSSVTLLKIRCFPEKIGPSCVIESIKHEQISHDVAKMVKETGFTGYASFDFIIDEDNNATLLECNPRPTPIMHISHLLGGNLCEILNTYLGVEKDVNPYPDVIHPIIALFPNELKRDPNSIFVKEHYHDVPTDDPVLIEFFNNDLKKHNIPPISVK